MEQEDRDAGPYLAHLASTLAAHGGGSLSADLALDLVLNEIVEQARLASTASAAAIALVAGDDMVCRATTGASAPGLGVRLAMHSGLSGDCVQSCAPQRCDDTEADPRVDAAAYRSLEIRSILMVPILSGEQLLGIFQIFSPRANEFGDREIQTLQALSRRIVNNVRYAAESKRTTPSSAEKAEVGAEKIRESQVHIEPPLPDFAEVQPTTVRTDYWTTVLTGLVVALALLLGWMAGRAGWEKATSERASARPASPSAPANPPLPQKPAPVPNVAASGPTKPSASSTSAEGISNAGLVVYEKGKIIYQAKPVVKASSSKQGTFDSLTTLPPETVSSLLIHRVEPEYPEVARNSQVQGEVSIQVIVDREGAVRELRVEDGDPQLAPAAVEAVRQWRFTPYQSNGANEEFQAHVIVRFKLP